MSDAQHAATQRILNMRSCTLFAGVRAWSPADAVFLAI